MFFFPVESGMVGVFVTMGSGVWDLSPVCFLFIAGDTRGLFLDLEENSNRTAFWAEVQARR